MEGELYCVYFIAIFLTILNFYSIWLYGYRCLTADKRTTCSQNWSLILIHSTEVSLPFRVGNWNFKIEKIKTEHGLEFDWFIDARTIWLWRIISLFHFLEGRLKVEYDNFGYLGLITYN